MPANLQTAAQQYFEQAQNNNPTSKLKLTVMAIPAVPMETPAKLYSGPIHLWSHADAEKPETEATNVQRANSVYPVSSLKI